MGKQSVSSGQIHVITISHMYFSLSLSQKMAFAAEPLLVNASSSPVYGENSIFCHKIVRNGSRIIGIRNLKDHFPERYTLEDLTNSLPESLECVEQAARDWIDNIPKQTNLDRSVVAFQCIAKVV